jgi:hypothetical protein
MTNFRETWYEHCHYANAVVFNLLLSMMMMMMMMIIIIMVTSRADVGTREVGVSRAPLILISRYDVTELAKNENKSLLR